MTTGNDADVVIVGAGVFGLACAWSCLRAGLRVIVAERDRPGAGASGGVMGALSPHVPDQWNGKKQFQFEALVAAGAYWAEVERVSHRETGFARIGRLIPIADEAARNRAGARSRDAAENWAGEAAWQVREAGEFDGWLDPAAAPCGVIFEDLSARLRPRDAVDALAGAVSALGGEIRSGWQVAAVEPGVARGAGGQLRARHIIVAAGVEAFALLSSYLGAGAGSGVKGQAMLLRAGAPAGAPTIFCDGSYVIAHGNGTIAIGSTSEANWDDAGSTDHQLDAVRLRVERLCPLLRGAEELQRWAGIRPKARRRDPMLGPVPGCDGLYVASGGFKIGFGLAPKVGDVMARLVQGEDVPLPESFAPEFHLI